jgi:drug/metabolite transporter (DMT)-like permease
VSRLPIAAALGAALLFGASTPAAKLLAGGIDPILLAGLLYTGSGLGLGAWFLARRARLALSARDLPWLAGAVISGGMVAPVLLMVGLASTSAAASSLLLNLEGVFTALLAWFAFRENFDRRIALGMAFIAAGGALLVLQPGALTGSHFGSLAIAGACLAWAIDNNLTRKVSFADATAIAAIKGLVAGPVNIAIAFVGGALWPGIAPAVGAATIGLFGYGVSLALFVVALRGLGAARTGAYFSTAPFAGVALALMLGETPAAFFWPAAALMAAGVWLHVSERHEHEHAHEPLEHEHTHIHDEHHQHSHGSSWDGKAPHQHLHRHERLVHRHPHYPDLHHRHH